MEGRFPDFAVHVYLLCTWNSVQMQQTETGTVS